MATVLLPASLLALFPGAAKRHEIEGGTVESIITSLEGSIPGVRDRLLESGPRLRRHINVFVDGTPADLATTVPPHAVVHILPAVSGG